MYEYRAQCVRVVDGDTVDLYVDLGFHSYRLERFRLLGIDTAELNSKVQEERDLAISAKNYMIQILQPKAFDQNHWPLEIKTEKTDSFGRWLCDIRLSGTDAYINDALIGLGYAKKIIK